MHTSLNPKLSYFYRYTFFIFVYMAKRSLYVIIMATVLVVVLFSGCKKNVSPFVGNWTLTNYNFYNLNLNYTAPDSEIQTHTYDAQTKVNRYNTYLSPNDVNNITVDTFYFSNWNIKENGDFEVTEDDGSGINAATGRWIFDSGRNTFLFAYVRLAFYMPGPDHIQTLTDNKMVLTWSNSGIDSMNGQPTGTYYNDMTATFTRQ